MTKTSFSLYCLGAVAVMLPLLFSSCSPRISAQLHIADTVYLSRTDSLYVRDSIYIDREKTVREKGDTVFVTEICTEFRDRWRYRDRTDTVYVDRISEEVITKEVEREETKFEKFQKGSFWALCGLLLAALIYGAFRLYKWIKK